jgi:hypothetical protein
LLVCVERPREDQNDQTHKHSCEDPHVLGGSAHLTPRLASEGHSLPHSDSNASIKTPVKT